MGQRARGGGTPGALAGVWAAVATLLALWGAVALPGRALVDPGPGGAVIADRPDAGAYVVSAWVWWESSRDGWLVLEAGRPWPAADEGLWRRRVHPGWNHLAWAPVSRLPAGAPLVLRVSRGDPEGWAATPPRTARRYGLEHLAPLRGLLVALLVAAGMVAAGAGPALAALRRPGRWGLAVAAVTAGAAWLRLHTLGRQSLWLDEVLTAIGAQSFDWVLYSPQVFGHPPLQYLIGWGAGGPGAGEVGLRIPFVAAGVATVPAVAWLGRVLFGPAAGLLAGLVLALSPFHVELSQTARPYAPLLLLAALSLLALLVALDGGGRRAWLGFSAAGALLVYTHHVGAAVVALEAVLAGLVLARRRGRGLGVALVSFSAVGLLLLPWVPVLARQMLAQVGQGHLPAPELTRLVVEAFLPQFLGPGPAGWLALALVGRGLGALRRRWPLALALVLWIVGPLAAVWLAQPAHFLSGRHLAFLLIPLALLLARGLTAAAADLRALAVRLAAGPRPLPRLAARATALLLLGVWALPTAVALGAYYERRLGFDWRAVAQVLDAMIPAGDPVAASAGAGYPLRHYWRGDLTILEPDGGLDPRWPPDPPRPRWVITHEGWDRSPELAAWLARHALPVAEVPSSWSLPGVRVWRLRGS